MKQLGGYIAISRSIFEHPMFREDRPHTRLEVWVWLISQAAWKPSGKRRRHSVVSLERGQLAATVRELGITWRWPKSKVARFLAELARENMIKADRIGLGTKNDPKCGIKSSYPITVITICKYDEFQLSAGRKYGGEGQKQGQKAGQELPQLPGIVMKSATEQNNQSTIQESAENGRRVHKDKPFHGATNDSMIWLDHGTMEWVQYAKDYHEVRGTFKFPSRYNNGLGNWFKKAGEASKKSRKQA